MHGGGVITAGDARLEDLWAKPVCNFVDTHLGLNGCVFRWVGRIKDLDIMKRPLQKTRQGYLLLHPALNDRF